MEISCKICKSNSYSIGKIDFNRSGNDNFTGTRNFPFSDEMVEYFKCTECGLIFTFFFDTWKKEDFFEKVYNKDYLLADPPFESERPAKLFSILNHVSNQNKSLKFLDYGGGDGKLYNLMNEAGYLNIDIYDPFYGYENLENNKYDIISCFEVVEHVPNQIELWLRLKSFLKENGFIIFSTLLQPNNILSILNQWWYLCPRNGHLLAHTKKSLEKILNEVGLKYTYITDELHLAFIEPKYIDIINFPSVFSEKINA